MGPGVSGCEWYNLRNTGWGNPGQIRNPRQMITCALGIIRGWMVRVDSVTRLSALRHELERKGNVRLKDQEQFL